MVIELESLKPEMAPPNKAAKIVEISTQSRPRKKNIRTIEIKPDDKTTMKNTMEKPAGTGEALEVSVVKKSQTSMTMLKPVARSGFDDQRGQKLPSGCMEPFMDIVSDSR